MFFSSPSDGDGGVASGRDAWGVVREVLVWQGALWVVLVLVTVCLVWIYG